MLLACVEVEINFQTPLGYTWNYEDKIVWQKNYCDFFLLKSDIDQG